MLKLILQHTYQGHVRMHTHLCILSSQIHACMHAHAHARTRAHTHTHTHTHTPAQMTQEVPGSWWKGLTQASSFLLGTQTETVQDTGHSSEVVCEQSPELTVPATTIVKWHRTKLHVSPTTKRQADANLPTQYKSDHAHSLTNIHVGPANPL